MATHTPTPNHWFVDAGFGPVFADINSTSVSATAIITGATRSGVNPGKGILFQIAAGEGFGELLIETDYGAPTVQALRDTPDLWSKAWVSLRPQRYLVNGTVTYAWLPGSTPTPVNYRVVWVAKQAAASVIVNSQLVDAS
jgi:hypothetical protein